MYIEITFIKPTETTKELIIAELLEAEGFEEADNGNLKAIFLKEQYDEALINETASFYNLQFEKITIAPQNWNALWESNFEPVVVDDFVGIRASFHKPIQNVEHEIIITPKMSFGTGHHATTFLMIQQMGKMDFQNKSVFDFGTGTGVLAILAQKLGAKNVMANDIDEWSIANAKENFENNNVHNIQLLQTDSGKIDGLFDTILANINRNVLIENMPILSLQLKPKAYLLLSGILEEDTPAIISCATNNNLEKIKQTQQGKWICLTLRRY